jgi:hypothetical protein
LFVVTDQILEGRKPTGGTVNVELRLRTPVSKPQIEVTRDRILFIDKHYTYEDALAMEEEERRREERQREEKPREDRRRQQEVGSVRTPTPEQRQVPAVKQTQETLKQSEQGSGGQVAGKPGTGTPPAKPAAAAGPDPERCDPNIIGVLMMTVWTG